MSVPHTLSSFLQLPQHVATVQLKIGSRDWICTINSLATSLISKTGKLLRDGPFLMSCFVV